MPTPFEKPITLFFKRIEEDKKFFNYINLSGFQSLEIAKERARGLLIEAASELALRCSPDIDFLDIDELSEVFAEDLTRKEVYLISSLMYQQYLERDIAKIKCLNVNYTPTELRVFDPSNARSTFQAIYEKVCQKNDMLIDEYESRDRITGALKGIDYPSFNTEEE